MRSTPSTRGISRTSTTARPGGHRRPRPWPPPAHDTLVKLVPQAAALVDAEYDKALSTVPDETAKDAGIKTGQAAAAAILTRRSFLDDLVAALTKPYTPGPARPGVYQLTPPLNIVIGAGWGELPPFALNRAAQFRPPAPPAVKSRRYTSDYNEGEGAGLSQQHGAHRAPDPHRPVLVRRRREGVEPGRAAGPRRPVGGRVARGAHARGAQHLSGGHRHRQL